MPGAPASTQTPTASSTSGECPPREFRSVATLLTLTDRRVIDVRGSTFEVRRSPSGERFLSEYPFDDVHDLLRPTADFLLMLPFEHHAQQRLGARVAHQQTPLSGNARLDPGDRR